MNFFTVYINWECVLKILAIMMILMNWALKSNRQRLRKSGTSKKKKKRKKEKKEKWPHLHDKTGLASLS